MGQSIGFQNTKNSITGKLTSYINKAKDARALLNGPLLQVFKNAQLMRFQTENASETGQWKQLSSTPINVWWLSEDHEAERQAWATGGYAAAKRFIYKDYPGAGSKLMIGTGKLVGALTGGEGFRKVVTSRSLVISVDDSVVPYAKYAALERPFMDFGDTTIQKMQDMIRAYMLGGDNG